MVEKVGLWLWAFAAASSPSLSSSASAAPSLLGSSLPFPGPNSETKRPLWWVEDLVLRSGDKNGTKCDVCHDVVRRVQRKLRKSMGEADVYVVLEGVCRDVSTTYSRSQRSFKALCEEFQDDYGEVFEEIFVKTVRGTLFGDDGHNLQANVICRETLELCKLYRRKEFEELLDDIQPMLSRGKLISLKRMLNSKEGLDEPASSMTMADYYEREEQRCLRDLESAAREKAKRRKLRNERREKKRRKKKMKKQRNKKRKKEKEKSSRPEGAT